MAPEGGSLHAAGVQAKVPTSLPGPMPQSMRQDMKMSEWAKAEQNQ
eukprot:CAMPEP_0197668616 /NCGR_PEP_ID=MMETSP1338-20131121/69839_1 /TAXON_ID=43686 ORGANISM="Pelagodinium beii, Strain RCC1491" /NCGR_SAMPLE_ID=MMETSP1338 /ASSEMBLY_ACC=CAM_ASM_000754 /LENGTH=45 /DNA_ID= /DNA_START= /DNA_END= /DNA_ORIENTATION=